MYISFIAEEYFGVEGELGFEVKRGTITCWKIQRPARIRPRKKVVNLVERRMVK